MSSFRSVMAAPCVCVMASLLTLTIDGMAEAKTELPTITFKTGDAAKALRKCPGGKVRIDLIGSAAQLSDAKTGKPIGGALMHDRAEEHATGSVTTCWAFSPDGQLVATGSRCADRDGSEGQICVWEVATGKRVAEYRGDKRQDKRLGNVEGVAFSADGKTVQFAARPFELTGK